MCLIKKIFVVCFSLIGFIFLSPAALVKQRALQLFSVGEVLAEVFYGIDEALKVLFPDARNIKKETKALTVAQAKAVEKNAKVKLDPKLDKEFNIYEAKSGDGKLLGYALENSVQGKWEAIHYLIALDAEGKITDAVVLEMQEKWGKPIKERKFLAQFFGKKAGDSLKLNKDVQQIAGATISSASMTNGIRKLLNVFSELYGKK